MIDLTPDSSYTLIVWAKMVGTGLDAITSYAGVEFKDADGFVISAPEVVFADTSDWMQYYLTFTVPSNAASTEVFTSLEAEGTANVVYTDDFALVAAVPVTGLTLSPETASIPLGLVKQLNATIEPSNAINQQLIWTSSDTTVAKVSSNGLVKAWKEGSATITVVSDEGSFSQSCEVTVGPRTDNLVLNPGFEQDITKGWKSDWGNSFISTDIVHSGNYGLAVGPDDGGRPQTITGLVPGGTYTLSAWGMLGGSDIDTAGGNFSIGMVIKDDLNQRLETVGTNIIDRENFSQVSKTFTLPMEAAVTYIFAYCEGRGGLMYTDNWALVSGWEPLPFVLSSDASLSSIFLFPGDLEPAFSPDVYSYTATVPEGTSSVFVRASASDPVAVYTGDGNVDVSSGSATVEIEVMAEDGTIQIYTIVINEEISVGIDEKDASSISLYPNPISAGNILQLEGIPGGENISILDMTGRIVFSRKLQGSEQELIQLDEQVTSGTYIFKVYGRTGVHTQLLMVK